MNAPVQVAVGAMPSGSRWSRIATASTLLVLFVIAAHSLWLAAEHGLFAPWGGGDFHAYWYYGHFVRQGVSPYHAFLTDPFAISLPVRYLDGVTAQQVPAELSMMPANTAPMLLLLSLFSWLSWPAAKAAWLSCNLLFALAVPWVVIRLLWHDSRLSAAAMATICLVFYGFYSTRVAMEMGQTTLIVLLLMLASVLLADRHWITSGACLGLALSKYSLSFPALALLVGARRWKVVMSALAVQGLGVVGVSLLRWGSLAETFEFYRTVLRAHAGQDGMHLAAQLPAGVARTIAVSILIGGVLILLSIWLWRRGWFRRDVDVRSPAALRVMNVVGLLTLLAIYHRGYDAAFAVLAITLTVREGFLGAQSGGSKLAQLLAFSLVVLALTLPTTVLRVSFAVFNVGGKDPIASAESLISVAVLVLLATSLVQLYQVQEKDVPDTR